MMLQLARRWDGAFASPSLLIKKCSLLSSIVPILSRTSWTGPSSEDDKNPSVAPNTQQQQQQQQANIDQEAQQRQQVHAQILARQKQDASQASVPGVREHVLDLQHAVTCFRKDPQAAASALVVNLTPAERVLLAAALAGHGRQQIQNDQKYKEDLFNTVEAALPQGSLSRREFQRFLVSHEKKEPNEKQQKPSYSALRMVFFASALPFVGFGFLDNFIMLLAGEEIDALFGARLGLTTLASAGLGNLVADVIGVGAASAIEQMVRRAPFIKNPSLSRQQMEMKVTKYSQGLGASLGVMVGCLLGLVPLLLSGHFFTHPH